MTNRPEGDARAERNQRRAAARERAAKARLQHKRRQRGVRLGLQVGLGVVLLAAATVVTLVLVDSTKPAGPGPSSMPQGGITIGQGMTPGDGAAGSSASSSPSGSATAGTEPVRITMYVDYLCPFCGQFEKTNSDYIEGLVESGVATVDIHPIAILANRSQGTKYSLRAANAAACVAQSSPDQFFAVNRALFAAQPEENTPGLTDAQLKKIVGGVRGISAKSTIATCIDDQRYGKWVDERTTAVSGGDIPGSSLKTFPGTPLVLVNGQQYEYSQPFTNEEFRTFVITVAGSGEQTPTPTPTSTRTPTPSASASAS
jgi:protein-disulfide isomerase